MSRRENEAGGCLLWFIVPVGVAAFLIMVHPLIFFLLVVPLAIIGIMAFIGWLKKIK